VSTTPVAQLESDEFEQPSTPASNTVTTVTAADPIPERLMPTSPSARSPARDSGALARRP
jgi:hypothetical protein